MPIYNKSVRMLMRDMVNDLGLEKDKIFTKKEVVYWFQKNYPKIKTGTISAHLICLSTNAPSRVHHNAKKGQDDLFYQKDGSHFRLYNPATDPVPIYASQKPKIDDIPENGDDREEQEETSEPVEPSEFAFESDLKNFLAKNLSIIEPQLRLYEDEGIIGIEFPAGGRFIDILALDAKNDYVVIELKVSRGYDRVIGQLLRYMAWIKKNQAEPSQQIRGIVIAREITEDLLLACSDIPNIRLFEYQLAITIKPVTINT